MDKYGTKVRRTAAPLLAAIDERTALIAVSQVLSADGEPADLVRLRAAADAVGAVGAQVFADVTPSLGVLGTDLAASRPDHLAVHGRQAPDSPAISPSSG